MQLTNVRANYDCNMRPNIFWKCKTFLLLTGCRHYLNIDPWRNFFLLAAAPLMLPSRFANCGDWFSRQFLPMYTQQLAHKPTQHNQRTKQSAKLRK